MDGNVVDYTNWETVENMDEEETIEDLMWDPTCTHISTETKRWRKKNCDHSYMSFICKTAKGKYC